MTVKLTLSDPDSARALAAMAMTLDSLDVLDSFEESVVETVVEEFYGQEPALNPDEMDEYVENLKDRLRENLE